MRSAALLGAASLLLFVNITQGQETVKFSHHQLTREFRAPEEDSCYHRVEYQFIRVLKAPTQQAADSINLYVDCYWPGLLRNRDTITSMLQLIEYDIKEVEAFSQRSKCPSLGTYQVYGVKTKYHDERIFSLSMYSTGYTGGVHPYHLLHLASFDLQSGHRLELIDIFVEDFRVIFDSIARQAVKSKYELIGEKGEQAFNNFRLTDSTFSTNQNFAVLEDGLLFQFNEYEIAAYAYGDISYTIPFSSLQGIIDPRGSLGYVLTRDAE